MDDAERVRQKIILQDLALEKPGLEISPLFRPAAIKGKHNVSYTDYTSTEESRRKHANHVHAEIVDIDFVWTPGRKLVDCVPSGTKYNWAIASHVLEHVPDPIGWLLEVFEVLEDGAIFSIVLPDRRRCCDLFRRETEVSDLLDTWFRSQKIPGPLQIYDFLSRSINIDFGGDAERFWSTVRLEEKVRTYTDKEALKFASHAWTEGTYIDVHCSVFSAESFAYIIDRLNDIGVLNVKASKPIYADPEFFVTLEKIGEPKFPHPGKPHALSVGREGNPGASLSDLQHARKAFDDAVKVQESLKMKIAQLERAPSLRRWVLYWFRRLASR